MANGPIKQQEIYRGILIAKLSNGLRVLIREDHRTPVAVCNVWVRVGSNREPDDVRGWAHGVEHLLFKGTARRGESDFALEVADMGGSTNAGTGYETTNYHITCPAEHVDRAVDILHDALHHAAFDPEALDAEREVLVHENHMYDDQPSGFGVTWKWALELAFDESPYRHPIGGLDEALRDTPREKIMEFWKRGYRPDQMTVVIVGDVESETVLDGVVARFGGEPACELPQLPDPAPEPEHHGLRYRCEQGDVQRLYGKIVLPGLSEGDPDRAVLSVLRQLLSDGRSSRLYRTVQEERELVSGITLLSESGPREGLLMVDFETGPEDLRGALGAVAEVLQALKITPPTTEELNRAKIRAERGHQMGLETVQGQAAGLGWNDVMSDLDGAFDHPARIAAVTADDVTRVARRLFRRSQASVLVYSPVEPNVAPPETAAEVDALLAAHLDDDPPPPPGVRPAPIIAKDHSRTAITGSDDLPFEELVLDGMRCYLRCDPALPVASVGLYATGGGALEPRGKEGLAALTQQVHAKAVRGGDAASLHTFVEERGASLSPFATRDHSGLHLTGLTRHLDELLDLLGELAAHPAFPEDEFEKERRFALEELQALYDDPFQHAALELRRDVYGNHPHGLPLSGTPESLATLTVADLADHHARTWVTRNLHVVVSGDVDRDALAARLEHALADLPRGRAPKLPDLSRVPMPDGIQKRRIERDVRQSVVLTAWRGPVGPDADRAALALLQSLLNGQSGRLFAELRGKRSLCYTSGMQVARSFAPGMIVGYVMTDPATEDEASAALAAELLRTAVEPATAEEFERARARLLGNLLISLQSNNARVGRCAADVLYGRAPNNLRFYLKEIRSMEPEMVRAAAHRYLGSEDRFEVVVGPAR